MEGEGRDEPSPEQLRRDLEEKFNVQRAKMKELFLQKEGLLSSQWCGFGTITDSVVEAVCMCLVTVVEYGVGVANK